MTRSTVHQPNWDISRANSPQAVKLGWFDNNYSDSNQFLVVLGIFINKVGSVIFVNENENVEKRENNEFVNENENMMKTKTKLKRKNRKRLKTKTQKSKTKMPK